MVLILSFWKKTKQKQKREKKREQFCFCSGVFFIAQLPTPTHSPEEQARKNCHNRSYLSQ